MVSANDWKAKSAIKASNGMYIAGLRTVSVLMVTRSQHTPVWSGGCGPQVHYQMLRDGGCLSDIQGSQAGGVMGNGSFRRETGTTENHC